MPDNGLAAKADRCTTSPNAACSHYGENGLELIEVAPGIDLDRDILDLMPFRPIINDPKPMAKALFWPELMGLRERMSDLGIDDPTQL